MLSRATAAAAVLRTDGAAPAPPHPQAGSLPSARRAQRLAAGPRPAGGGPRCARRGQQRSGLFGWPQLCRAAAPERWRRGGDAPAGPAERAPAGSRHCAGGGDRQRAPRDAAGAGACARRGRQREAAALCGVWAAPCAAHALLLLLLPPPPPAVPVERGRCLGPRAQYSRCSWGLTGPSCPRSLPVSPGRLQVGGQGTAGGPAGGVGRRRDGCTHCGPHAPGKEGGGGGWVHVPAG